MFRVLVLAVLIQTSLMGSTSVCTLIFESEKNVQAANALIKSNIIDYTIAQALKAYHYKTDKILAPEIIHWVAARLVFEFGEIPSNIEDQVKFARARKLSRQDLLLIQIGRAHV